MERIDWVLLVVPTLLVIGFAIYTRRFVKSVADFMAGGRSAGRYLICNASGEAAAGVANTMSKFQTLMVAGFVLSWWDVLSVPILLLTGIFGFVVYRYRQTRVLTLGQFFEMRYSRRFRLFAGGLGFLSGVLNYGVFPAISSRFFVYFLDLPEVVHPFGLNLPTYVPIMALYLTCAMLMMTLGGQITLMVTDCIEGILSHAIYLVVVAAVFWTISWSQMRDTLFAQPTGQSMLNPFDALDTKDFNVWFTAMTLFMTLYSTSAWQNGHGFRSAARTPHELRMGSILGHWRAYARNVMLVVLSIAAVTFLKHPEYGAAATRAHDAIASLDPNIAKQMKAPIALRYMLPTGVKGLFCTIMVLGLMAGDSTHMLSWGGIFIQDVILPFRKTPLTPKQHVRILRLAVMGVATFAFFFSIAFQLRDYIAMWWKLTESIFTAGAGAAIIGGLYWKRGTTAGAWAGQLTGLCLAFIGVLGPYAWPYLPATIARWKTFPLNGLQVAFGSALISFTVYFVTSLLTHRTDFDMDRLLHRGKYAVAEDGAAPAVPLKERLRLSRILNLTGDFTRNDRAIAIGVFGWSMLMVSIVLVGTIWNYFQPWAKTTWANYWFIVGIIVPLVIACITLVWFGIGGVVDLFSFFARLRTLVRDETDDGRVAQPAQPVVPVQRQEPKDLALTDLPAVPAGAGGKDA